jgi:hypothetical protein
MDVFLGFWAIVTPWSRWSLAVQTDTFGKDSVGLLSIKFIFMERAAQIQKFITTV